ncbi:MAG: cytochrome c oxidase subunit II [Euzebyales bacterium]|nr:cytochrome c oxidase subunit II [Euzebyales bacterium]
MRARRPRWSSVAKVALITGFALLLAACGTSDLPQDALTPAGPTARAQDDLWKLVFPIAVVVFVLVQGLIIFAVIRFRAKGDEVDLPKQVAGNTRLEIAWTIVPALLLLYIAFPTVATIFEQAAEPDEAERVDVTVVGKQYWWEFVYPQSGVVTANEMVIPTGTPVYVQLDGIATYELDDGAEDQASNLVMHSFWVPKLAGKVDFVPGHDDRYVTLEADEPGRYAGQCAEFCGLSHANMKFDVVAVEPAEYDDWIAAQSEEAGQPEDEQLRLGYDLFGANCVACHAVDGHEASVGVRTGPNLTHFASRETFAGGIFENADTEQLKAWIANPQREKPGAQMIPFGSLADEELDALAAYLQSLD